MLKNFQAIRLHGFQGVRADKVVAEMGITKGALYHYFPTKFDLGYAIVDELLAPSYLSVWRPLETARKNQMDVLLECIESFKKKNNAEEVKLGCPLNNLMQEMSPLDEGFQVRLGTIVSGMVRSIETGIKNGQVLGNIRADADARQLAFFIVSSIEGSYGVAKSLQSKEAFDASLNQLILLIQTIRN
jgi:AcrR family transcriptional regulator